MCVLTGKLKKEDSISIVRVYGSQTELHCYPLPARIEPHRRFRRDTEVDPFCKSIALHEIIRNNNTPDSEEINTLYDQIWELSRQVDKTVTDAKKRLFEINALYDQIWELSRQVDKTVTDAKKRLFEMKEKYKKAVTIASRKVLCSKDVIICTCATSGHPLLSPDSNFKVKQVKYRCVSYIIFPAAS